MKYLMMTVFFSLLFCTVAYAQTPAPCPGQVQEEVKPADPNEKCKPDFDKLKTAPVVFDFPTDSKSPEASPSESPAVPQDEKKN